MLSKMDPVNPGHCHDVAKIWSQACGNCFAISPAFVRYNMGQVPGLRQEGRFSIIEADVPAGFVVASVLADDALASPPWRGWVDAIAVLPEYQARGLGSGLIDWAEEWLRGQGCTEVSLGASIRAFTPGLPPDTLSESFFVSRGYGSAPEQTRKLVWDVASDLAEYEAAVAGEIDGQVRPARPGDEDALKTFLHREFPGRWRFECEQYLADGARVSDFMLLWSERGVDGFCLLTFEDSLRPMERYYPYALPRPWGQLGPIAVSADARGRGYGAALLDSGLRRLRDSGVRGCVIDWTDLLDFYAKFGFSQYREYVRMTKRLA